MVAGRVDTAFPHPLTHSDQLHKCYVIDSCIAIFHEGYDLILLVLPPHGRPHQGLATAVCLERELVHLSAQQRQYLPACQEESSLAPAGAACLQLRVPYFGFQIQRLVRVG